jgi:hypothetical protein
VTPQEKIDQGTALQSPSNKGGWQPQEQSHHPSESLGTGGCPSLSPEKKKGREKERGEKVVIKNKNRLEKIIMNILPDL